MSPKLAKLAGLVILLAGAVPLESNESDLVVHEWGTFLAMSGSDGVALDVTGEPVAVAFAGTGRIRLDSAQADGEVSVTPSAPAGFADALNIYGP